MAQRTLAKAGRRIDYYRGMRGFWHPVARSEDVDPRPFAARLLDEELVLVRLGGTVVAMQDLCIHRGARLSIGRVAGEELVCAYHGWRYGADGRCTRIPQIPDRPIPRRACCTTYHCQERYGLIWVCLSDAPLAEIAPLAEFEDQRFRSSGWVVERWSTSAPRICENFMDIAHLSFVHDGTLGDSSRPEMEDYTVRREGWGIIYSYTLTQPDNYGVKGGRGGGSLLRTLTRRWVHMPATAWIKKELPTGDVMMPVMTASPVSRTETVSFWTTLRNFALDEPDERFRQLDQFIRDQDRVIVENQRPEELPADLAEELHLKGPDDASLVYRRWLSELGIEAQPVRPR